MFTSVGNQAKKNMYMLKDLSEEFIKYAHSEWTEFTVHEKKYNNELSNYLTLKSNLLKKKERNIGDISKWELSEKEMFRMSRVNTSNVDKEEAFWELFVWLIVTYPKFIKVFLFFLSDSFLPLDS